ncbi:MAG: YraN family protein [Lachnospiraceae bacterium]|nr:YraN family protein [Lachnospiraceae bacterium]
MENKRTIGSKYEQIAAQELEKKGYTILEHNYRCVKGEIDLIAKKNDTIVFTEVKYRINNVKGNPSEAVDKRKRRRISGAALFYLATRLKRMDVPCRFDVISILDDEIIHFENAFDFQS